MAAANSKVRSMPAMTMSDSRSWDSLLTESTKDGEKKRHSLRLNLPKLARVSAFERDPTESRGWKPSKGDTIGLSGLFEFSVGDSYDVDSVSQGHERTDHSSDDCLASRLASPGISSYQE